MTEFQCENWFKSHPPTDVTRPKYAQIRAMEDYVFQILFAAVMHKTVPDVEATSPNADGTACSVMRLAVAKQERFEAVNDACKKMALCIAEATPSCMDQHRAIQAIRLAKMYLNEAIATENVTLATFGYEQLRQARFWANTAIACGTELGSHAQLPVDTL